MKRILLVEDESDLINILDVVFSDEGYHVTQMRSAEEALQFCQVRTPDLIVSDIKMGPMDGLTMYEKIRSMPKLSNVPFVVISAFNDTAFVKRAKALGVAGYFVKPFDVDEVVRAIKKLLTAPTEKERTPASV
ncbi:MAG TPA: response regulator [Bacteroidota bacterium]